MTAQTPFERQHDDELAIIELADALDAIGALPAEHPGIDSVRHLVALVRFGRMTDPSQVPQPIPKLPHSTPQPPPTGLANIPREPVGRVATNADMAAL